jgi:hypothetical protein
MPAVENPCISRYPCVRFPFLDTGASVSHRKYWRVSHHVASRPFSGDIVGIMFKILSGGLLALALAGCADVGTTAAKLDPAPYVPKYLTLTCQDASADACRFGIGKQPAPADPTAH